MQGQPAGSPIAGRDTLWGQHHLLGLLLQFRGACTCATERLPRASRSVYLWVTLETQWCDSWLYISHRCFLLTLSHRPPTALMHLDKGTVGRLHLLQGGDWGLRARLVLNLKMRFMCRQLLQFCKLFCKQRVLPIPHLLNTFQNILPGLVRLLLLRRAF